MENEYSDKEAEEQAGFRAGRSCNDNTCVIKQPIEMQLSVQKEVHLLFIDFKKAYVKSNLIKLWKALEETGKSYTLIKTIKELYRKILSYIKLGRLLSEEFDVMKGLRQGCCLSPTLFKIYRGKALNIWKRKYLGRGYNVDNTMICRSQWPRGLRRRSLAARLLRLWVRIPPGEWTFVFGFV